MDVKKIAKLAHLEITDQEAEMYSSQMEEIVAYVEQLNELNTEEVDVSIGGLTEEGELTDTRREDIVQGSIGQSNALEQAPSAVDGHFQVPKVLK